jgi:hypothetical protein
MEFCIAFMETAHMFSVSMLRLTYRVSVLRTSMMSELCEPPPGWEVGELSARPLSFYIVFLAERRFSIALRYTENKGY